MSDVLVTIIKFVAFILFLVLLVGPITLFIAVILDRLGIIRF